jgi:hypothetical protein
MIRIKHMVEAARGVLAKGEPTEPSETNPGMLTRAIVEDMIEELGTEVDPLLTGFEAFKAASRAIGLVAFAFDMYLYNEDMIAWDKAKDTVAKFGSMVDSHVDPHNKEL